MTRLPRCAECGADLQHLERMTLDYVQVPGKPRIAWCLAHAPGDLSEFVHSLGHDRDLAAALLVIGRRGPGRVLGVAGRAWERWRDAALDEPAPRPKR